ncbi:retrovirus-related pol polyprotein from transposon TNT 1-94 [Tanacetum coccineum]
MGYGDYQIGNVTIYRVYYVEGLGHNLFSVGQFCDLDLEVAFRKHTCFVRNLKGVDLLSRSWGTNLYTLSIGNMLKSSSICLLSKASKTKSWLWHRRLSHLNFGTINQLAKQGLVRGLLKLKFEKGHLCSACSSGKGNKHSHKPKSKDTNQEKLYLLHIDLCGRMRVKSINGKKYILVIVDDYSQFTWVKLLRSKDKALEFIIKFLKMIQVCLNATIKNIRTDNGTEFVNQTMRSYYEDVDLGKLKAKADVGFFIGYAPANKAYRIYNRRTKRIMETIHVDFDELTAMASKQSSPGPTLGTLNSGLVPQPPSSTPVDHPVPKVLAPEAIVSTGTPSSTFVDQDAPSLNHDIKVAHMDNNPYFGIPIPKPSSEESSSQVVTPNNVHSLPKLPLDQRVPPHTYSTSPTPQRIQPTTHWI